MDTGEIIAIVAGSTVFLIFIFFVYRSFKSRNTSDALTNLKEEQKNIALGEEEEDYDESKDYDEEGNLILGSRTWEKQKEEKRRKKEEMEEIGREEREEFERDRNERVTGERKTDKERRLAQLEEEKNKLNYTEARKRPFAMR